MLAARRFLAMNAAIGDPASYGSISSICVLGVSTKHTFTPCAGRSNGSPIAVAPITSRQ